MLEVRDIAYRYPSSGVRVLERVSFALAEGDVACLLGPNGTGKTTLLKCILCLLRPDAGSIWVDDSDAARLSSAARSRLMAYVPQATTMAFPYLAEEVVLMGRTAHFSAGGKAKQADFDAADAAMELLGIAHLKDKLFNEMSGGERQMAVLARAIAQDARLLIMDEPTANLDYGNQVKMLRAVRALAGRGYGVLMTSHFPDHAFLACSKAILMKGGLVVAQGDPAQVVTTEALTDLYGTQVSVSQAVDCKGDLVKVCIPSMD